MSNGVVPVVAERTMYWDGASRTEGHSSVGAGATMTTAYLAEGIDSYSTFLAVLNPGPTALTLELRYLHESGATYTQTETVPAYSRATPVPTSSITWGTYAVEMVATNGVPFVAERSLYTGTNWKVLDTSLASSETSTTWQFAEGATGTFHEYVLLGNPSSTPATVNLRFKLENGGAVVNYGITVPARSRATVDVNGVPGLSSAIFATTVTSNVPIVAERAMYWPTSGAGWSAMHLSRGRAW
ncbi:MAG: hypothetical protein ACREJT_18025 [Myxococcota bacterium]